MFSVLQRGFRNRETVTSGWLVLPDHFCPSPVQSELLKLTLGETELEFHLVTGGRCSWVVFFYFCRMQVDLEAECMLNPSKG